MSLVFCVFMPHFIFKVISLSHDFLFIRLHLTYFPDCVLPIFSSNIREKVHQVGVCVRVRARACVVGSIGPWVAQQCK